MIFLELIMPWDYFPFLTPQDDEEVVSRAESEEKKIIDPNSDEVSETAAKHIIEYETCFFFIKPEKAQDLFFYNGCLCWFSLLPSLLYLYIVCSVNTFCGLQWFVCILYVEISTI